MLTITVPGLAGSDQQVGVPDSSLVLSGSEYQDIQGASYVALDPPIGVAGTAVPEDPIAAEYQNYVLAKVLGRGTLPSASGVGVVAIPTPEGLVIDNCPGTNLQFVTVEAV